MRIKKGRYYKSKSSDLVVKADKNSNSTSVFSGVVIIARSPYSVSECSGHWMLNTFRRIKPIIKEGKIYITTIGKRPTIVTASKTLFATNTTTFTGVVEQSGLYAKGYYSNRWSISDFSQIKKSRQKKITLDSKIEYGIVECESKEALISEVNRKLSEGWKLQGGVSLAVVDYSYYAQAIKRRN